MFLGTYVYGRPCLPFLKVFCFHWTLIHNYKSALSQVLRGKGFKGKMKQNKQKSEENVSNENKMGAPMGAYYAWIHLAHCSFAEFLCVQVIAQGSSLCVKQSELSYLGW